MLAPDPTVNPLIQLLIDYHFPAYPSVTGLQQPITARSLAGFFGALAWAWLLLVAFTGWGRLAGKLARVERLPASIACSLGIAAVIFIGGFLNLAHLIDRSVLFGVAGLGVLLYGSLLGERAEKYRWSQWRSVAPSPRTWAQVLLVAAVAILALRVAAMVRISEFDAIDDGSAYLAFPGNLLAYHHLAPGPFSDRHIISSVGGGYVLQAMVLAATTLGNIGMADRVFGLVLLLAALWDLGIVFGLSLEQIALLEFLAFLVPQQTANLTYIVLPTVLLLSLLWFIFQTPEEVSGKAWRYAVLAGAIGGATVALKSTFLPCVGSFCLVPYVVMLWRRKRLAFGLPIVAGAGALIVMAAWMLALKHSSGTYLYPVLGRGLDYSSYGIFHSFKIARTPRTVIKLFLHAVALFALAVVLVLFRWKSRRVLFGLSVLAGSALGITAFNLAAGGDSIWRYDFPQFFSAILIYFAVLAALSQGSLDTPKKKMAIGLAVVSMLGCVIYYDLAGTHPQLFRQARWESSRYLGALQGSLSGRSLSSPAIAGQYRAINAALPVDGATLENLADPFRLDQQAHRVLLMDWAGAAGPAPGWPFGKDATAVAKYLQHNSVRYVAYDRRYGRWMDASSCQVLERPQRYSAELYVLFWMTLLTHDQLNHLLERYQSLYDDGQIAVVDLTRPLKNALPEGAVWSIDTNKEAMCSTVMERYLKHPLQDSGAGKNN